MARIRSLHPTLFTDEAYASLPIAARVLLTGIWTECDDHGIFEWKPLGLKMKVFPADAYTGADMAEMLAAMVAQDCIQQFEMGGKSYGAVRNFCRWQRPKKPTYWHPFKGATPQDLPAWCVAYVAIGSPPVENHADTATEKAPQMEDGGCSRREEPQTTTEKPERVTPATDDEPPAPPSETLSPAVSPSVHEEEGLPVGPKLQQRLGIGKPLPPDWTPNDQLCEEVKQAFSMTDADLASELPAFHALNVQNGTISPNWNSTFYLFCKRWREHRDKQAAPRVQLNRAPPSAPRFVPTDADWEAAAKLYASTGRWPKGHGPDPMSTGCKCPRVILEKHEINPDTGDRRIPPRKVSA